MHNSFGENIKNQKKNFQIIQTDLNGLLSQQDNCNGVEMESPACSTFPRHFSFYAKRIIFSVRKTKLVTAIPTKVNYKKKKITES